MNNFEKAEAIEDLYHCHDKRELAKMVVKLEGDIQEMVAKAAANKLDGYRDLSERACRAEEELASCQRMYANACATLGEMQGYLGNEIVGIEPRLLKQLIQERDELRQCVPVEVTKEMMEAALDAYMPFGDMHLAIQAAIACLPKPTEGG